MDYEVFLLTRVSEYYEKTRNNTLSVALGVGRTAGIITSAALILIMVASGFTFAAIVAVKAIGLGIAIAVAVDATIVRGLLVPATMKLLGDWNWWIPAPLARLLPKIKVD
jgi:RND superfamily putative drug exporter